MKKVNNPQGKKLTTDIYTKSRDKHQYFYYICTPCTSAKVYFRVIVIKNKQRKNKKG